ncbi:MAG: DNA translocase FtsK 4TM domain-containing protein [Alphaproteobacteria bacterium]|nr:DNA translocase FtsK 4TM domain-containing protein [Alphaproteobacteria bacterium]
MFSEYHNEDRYTLLSKAAEGALRRGLGKLCGVILLSGIAICWLSLLSWSVSDPSLTHATRAAAANLLGYPGAVVSDLMLQTFGIVSSVLLLAPMLWALELTQNCYVARPRWKILSFAASLVLLAGAFSIIPKFLFWPLNHGYGGIAGDGVAAVAIWGFRQAAADFADAISFVVLLGFGMFFVFASVGVSVARMREIVAAAVSEAKRPARRRHGGASPIQKAENRQEPWFPPLNKTGSRAPSRQRPAVRDEQLPDEGSAPRWRQGSLSERHWREPHFEATSDFSARETERPLQRNGEPRSDEAPLAANEPSPGPSARREGGSKTPDFVPTFDDEEDRYEPRGEDFDAMTDAECKRMAERFRPVARMGNRSAMREILHNATFGLVERGETGTVIRQHEELREPLEDADNSDAKAADRVTPVDQTGQQCAPESHVAEQADGGDREDAFDAFDKPAEEVDSDAASNPQTGREQSSPIRPPQGTVRKAGGYCRPSLNLLKGSSTARPGPELTEAVLRGTSRLLEDVLERFGVKGTIEQVRPGPVVTTYEVQLDKGTNPMRVVGLADDIGRAMRAGSVRVGVMPLAGGAGVVIETANVHRYRVSLRELLSGETYRSFGGHVPVALGQSTGGQSVIADLAALGNILIAGRESTGKSTLLRSMVLSLVYRSSPDDCRLVLFDPKLLEFGAFNGAPHLLCPVLSENEKMLSALEWVVGELDERLQRMARLGVGSLEIFNNRVRNARKRGEMIARNVQTGFCKRTDKPIYEFEQMEFEPMPHIFVAIDELSSLMSIAPRECERALLRIAEKGGGVGIHLAAGTKTTSGLCLTEKVKAAMRSAVSFKLGSKIDSRIVIGEPGAEQLLEHGDAILSAGSGRKMRIHTPFVLQEEVDAVTAALRAGGPSRYAPGLMARLQEAVEPYPEALAASPGK